MKKILKLLLPAIFLVSCNGDKKCVLYIKFDHSLDGYYFEGAIKDSGVTVGNVMDKFNIVNSEENIYYSVLKVSFNSPVPAKSTISFEVQDEFNNNIVKLYKSTNKNNYSDGDTLIGDFKNVSAVIGTSDLDTLKKQVDPVVREIFRLNKKDSE
ncbi:hypothetical protein [Taibaiella chishuiensis]|uniref:Lipoprotein n=1 Tax=Taibaiella chishuiensis TaxID=1434707 RepID=A0A2P8D046_9BACT|nr:hypothetical protein [Taibaiella chishuiensis]PSK90598.1 hypothetical protein B0I18_1078 [Taibaiella chishuiensis]